MSRNSLKKRKRLKKGHIWPSVVFLLFAMLLSFVAFSAFTSIILTYFAQDRLRAIYDNAESVVHSFSDSPDPENDSKIMQYLENYADFTDAVYLFIFWIPMGKFCPGLAELPMIWTEQKYYPT